MAANNNNTANTPPVAVDKEQLFGMASTEMEYRVEMFKKLTNTCFAKCVEKRYKESELNADETSCIDRCVSKYNLVTNLVGQLLGFGACHPWSDCKSASQLRRPKFLLDCLLCQFCFNFCWKFIKVK